jgi:uncharacterized protein (TIGR02147 family)
LKIKIFNYFDYCEYLTDFYNLKKSTDSSFSHRSFLKKAGISGSVYLQRILKGERKLSVKFIPNFNTALEHTPKEAKYFQLLVQFQNEKKPSVKEEFLRQLLSLRHTQKEYIIEDKKLNFYDKWYYPVIRELVTFLDFKDDYRKLARVVQPKISPVQAEGAVKYLLKNGFIKKNDHGRYSHVKPVITTGPNVQSTKVIKYHKNNLMLCADALEEIPREERDISSITLSVSNQTYENIKDEIRNLRKRLLQIAKKDPNPERVCLVGFQLVPRTKNNGGPE